MRDLLVHWPWALPLVAWASLLMLVPSPVKLAGQSAKVVPLYITHALEAKRLHDKLMAAEAEWQAFRRKIEREYLTTTELQGGSNVGWTDPNDVRLGTASIHKCAARMLRIAGTPDDYDSPLCVEWRKQHPPEPQPPPRYKLQGFENGFEFSQDFRFVVPAAKASPSSCLPWSNSLILR